MIVTEWFHCDCIANYYDLETFSPKHCEYIGKFMGNNFGPEVEKESMDVLKKLVAKHDAEAAHSLPFSSHRVSLLSHAL